MIFHKNNTLKKNRVFFMLENIEYSEKSEKLNFESKQNAVGFFDLLLKIAKRNPEIWKNIYKEKQQKGNENNKT